MTVPDDDASDGPPTAFPPPGMRSLMDEYRRKYPAFRAGPAPSSEPWQESKHPLMDALLEEYRAKGLL